MYGKDIEQLFAQISSKVAKPTAGFFELHVD